MEKTIDAEFAARFPTIRNCNFRTRDDVTGGDVWSAILDVFEGGCDDADLLAELDSLEEVLAEHAESDSESSVIACEEAEEAVQSEWKSMRSDGSRWARRTA